MPISLPLSVVIPTLNEEANISAAVAAAWCLQPLEVLVCDGGSTDRTCELAIDAGATLVECDRGRGQQLNAGAKQATGEVLLFLHADTWLVPSAAAEIDQALQKPEVKWGAFKQSIDSKSWVYRALEWGNALRAKHLKTPYGDQAMFVRRETFCQVGGFPQQPIMEDVALSRQLAKSSRPAFLNGPLHISARRWRQYGVVRQTVRNWAFLLLWRMGVSPATLAKVYQPHSNRHDDPPVPQPASHRPN